LIVFSKYLQQIRKSRGLTQKQLASLSGISPSYLSRVERAERNIPHPSILKKIADSLGISEFDMLAMAGYISPDDGGGLTKYVPSHWNMLIADPSVDNALKQLGSLSQQEKKSLTLYLQAIKLQRENDSIPS